MVSQFVACSKTQPNADHCANNEGDVYCAEVSPETPFGPLSEGNRVATSTLCELGSVDPDKGIAIRLSNVLDVVDHPADITFQWLADRLQVSPVEIWAAPDRPNNEGFVSALYAAKASEWGYEINEPGTPFMSPFGDDYTPPLKIAIPHEPPPHAEALRWLDDGQNSQPDWFYSWSLPRAELWLPKGIATMAYMSAIDAAGCRELDASPLGLSIATSDS